MPKDYWSIEARLERLQGLSRPRRINPLVSVTGQKPMSMTGMFGMIRKPRHKMLLKQIQAPSVPSVVGQRTPSKIS